MLFTYLARACERERDGGARSGPWAVGRVGEHSLTFTYSGPHVVPARRIAIALSSVWQGLGVPSSASPNRARRLRWVYSGRAPSTCLLASLLLEDGDGGVPESDCELPGSYVYPPSSSAQIRPLAELGNVVCCTYQDAIPQKVPSSARKDLWRCMITPPCKFCCLSATHTRFANFSLVSPPAQPEREGPYYPSRWTLRRPQSHRPCGRRAHVFRRRYTGQSEMINDVQVSPPTHPHTHGHTLAR
ncbi:hypothetical protein C8Q74DRAFT_115974 [Fomes fomentarius]|nr:hypothetical protein C8Q74DRAFT_115974 [Fomes fomentarius]